VSGSERVEAAAYHGQLLTVAEQLLDDAQADDRGSWSATIVVSGLACDAAAAYALRCLLQLDAQRAAPRLSSGKSRGLRELLRSKKTVNLKPKAQREIWEALSGDRLTRWPDWIRYVRCVERRNAVLHEGVLPSRRPPARADALEAVEVARSLSVHLAHVTGVDPLVGRAD
jgi:hypothetical protein